MASDVASAGSPTARQRKACLNCYEKKIKCDFSPELGTCSRCRQQALECIVPDGNPAKSRSSLRQAVGELEDRVQSLESSVRISSVTSQLQPSRQGSFASSPRADQRPHHEAMDSGYTDGERSSNSSSVPLVRGATSPWSILLGGTASADFPSFHNSTSQLSDEETSLFLSFGGIRYDISRKAPSIGRDQAHVFVRNYATIAPYPILNWGHLVGILDALLDYGTASTHGQVACIWIYMAFGCTQYSAGMRSDTEAGESSVYFQKAWTMLPRLLMDNDLWAMKAVTLMVHYLQASAKPEACWSLLGTALRLSISLGFHAKESNLAAYTESEREEGKRAFWLCYIMEKSLCINLGRPSSFNTHPTAPLPEPFQPANTTSEADLNDLYTTNETDAVAYFIDMIELTRDRDLLFQILHDPSQDMSPVLDSLQQRLTQKPPLHSPLRTSIRDLAYHNTILIISSRPQAISTSPLPLLSARTTLDIITTASHEGELMCVWMWLYYAFTAATVLFLHCVANPTHPDTALNIACIGDLETICEGLKEVSEGAKRIMNVARGMREVVFALVKKGGRKRGVELGDEGLGEGRGKVRRIEEGEGSEGEGLAMQAQGDVDAGVATEDILEGLPEGFAWDEWDRWLVNADLEGGVEEAEASGP